MTKHLLAVLMDGITDTQMLLDYAEACEEQQGRERWFMQHAKQRLEMLRHDRDDVFDELGIERKSKDGDEIAAALMSYIDMSIERLGDKVCGAESVS